MENKKKWDVAQISMHNTDEDSFLVVGYKNMRPFDDHIFMKEFKTMEDAFRFIKGLTFKGHKKRKMSVSERKLKRECEKKILTCCLCGEDLCTAAQGYGCAFSIKDDKGKELPICARCDSKEEE